VYRSDESLIIYRPGRRFAVDALVPAGQVRHRAWHGMAVQAADGRLCPLFQLFFTTSSLLVAGAGAAPHAVPRRQGRCRRTCTCRCKLAALRAPVTAHPLPQDPYPDWQRQIFNAWWNGYILGYVCLRYPTSAWCLVCAPCVCVCVCVC
jgi:hypothetical protein